MTISSLTLRSAPPSSGRRVLLGGSMVLLLGAIALVIYGGHRPMRRTFHGHVADLLPTAADLPGWTIQELPIADTPEMQKKVGEVLNFDDGAFCIYTHGTDRLSVYIAYWTPGRMSSRLVAGHTPDVCWVNGGWKVDAAESGAELAVDISGPGTPQRASVQAVTPLLPAEERTMSKDGATEYVAFWHRVGDEIVSYRTHGLPPWYAAFGDMLRRGLDQRQEQFFIRISSNRPVSEWPELTAYRKIMQRMPLRKQ